MSSPSRNALRTALRNAPLALFVLAFLGFLHIAWRYRVWWPVFVAAAVASLAVVYVAQERRRRALWRTSRMYRPRPWP